MELVITLFLGAWIAIGGFLAYRSVKREYGNRKGENE